MKVFCSMFSYLNIEMNFARTFTALHTPTSGLIGMFFDKVKCLVNLYYCQEGGMFLIKLSALFNLYYDQEGQPNMLCSGMHIILLTHTVKVFPTFSHKTCTIESRHVSRKSKKV